MIKSNCLVQQYNENSKNCQRPAVYGTLWVFKSYISIQQMWKLRERNFFIYTAIKWQSWSLNLGSLASRVTTLWSDRLKLD